MHHAVKLRYGVDNLGEVGSTAVYPPSWIHVNSVRKVANATLQTWHWRASVMEKVFFHQSNCIPDVARDATLVRASYCEPGLRQFWGTVAILWIWIVQCTPLPLFLMNTPARIHFAALWYRSIICNNLVVFLSRCNSLKQLELYAISLQCDIKSVLWDNTVR